MTTVEKMSIALPPEMAATVRQAVEAGEYASNSEVIREALRDWSYQRDLHQRGLDDLRAMWDETMIDTHPHVPPKEILQRLRAKYQALADLANK